VPLRHFFLSWFQGILKTMPVYSKTQLLSMIAALDAEIAKTEPDQAHVSGGPAQGSHSQRGALEAKYKERERLCKEYERLELREQGGGVRLAVFPDWGGRR
jgi:hypothetical protein